MPSNIKICPNIVYQNVKPDHGIFIGPHECLCDLRSLVLEIDHIRQLGCVYQLQQTPITPFVALDLGTAGDVNRLPFSFERKKRQSRLLYRGNGAALGSTENCRLVLSLYSTMALAITRTPHTLRHQRQRSCLHKRYRGRVSMALNVHAGGGTLVKILLYVAGFTAFVIVALTWVPELISPDSANITGQTGSTARMIN